MCKSTLIFKVDLHPYRYGRSTYAVAAYEHSGPGQLKLALSFVSPYDPFQPERAKAALGRLVGVPPKKLRDSDEAAPKSVHIVLNLDALGTSGGEFTDEQVPKIILKFFKKGIHNPKSPVLNCRYVRREHEVYSIFPDEDMVLSTSGKIRIPEWFVEAGRVSYVGKLNFE